MNNPQTNLEAYRQQLRADVQKLADHVEYLLAFGGDMQAQMLFWKAKHDELAHETGYSKAVEGVVRKA